MKRGIAREARPYSACAPFEFPSTSSGKASPCSDYMKSRNDTHFQAPLLRVTQRLDEAYDEYYTTVNPGIQQELEQAVLAAISTIDEFPFLRDAVSKCNYWDNMRRTFPSMRYKLKPSY